MSSLLRTFLSFHLIPQATFVGYSFFYVVFLRITKLIRTRSMSISGSLPLDWVFFCGKWLGGSSTINGASAMVLLSSRHFYRTLSLIQPFTEQSVVLNTGDAVKTKNTPIAIAALKIWRYLSIALSSLSNILHYSLEMPLCQINNS